MMIQWGVLLGLLVTVGCGSQIKNVPVANIVMVNAKGQAVDPTGNIPCLWDWNGSQEKCHSKFWEYEPYNKPFNGYNAHIDQVLKGLKDYKPINNAPQKKILIFVHGGLNHPAGAVERAEKLSRDILKGGAYPIFINWDSSGLTSYRNHVLRIRQGEDWGQGTWSHIGAYLTAPFYFAADLARAGIRVPTATFFQVRNDLETVPWSWARWFHSADLVLAQQTAFYDLCSRKRRGDPIDPKSLEEYSNVLGKPIGDCERPNKASQHHLENIKVSYGLDRRGDWERYEAAIKYFLTLPTKLVLAPGIDALGTSSWEIMLRSASQLFHYDSRQVSHTDLGYSDKDEQRFNDTGALYYFLERLTEQICPGTERSSVGTYSTSKECAKNDGWEITLVGHSMGTIIVNHIIREFGYLPIKNVVYMAAATTIKDYQDTIFPYLTEKNASILSSNPAAGGSTSEESEQCRYNRRIGVCVYHLMLHEAAESGEWINKYIDPLPRGSLLVWLDNFLTHPLSREDRMLGRFTNFIMAAHHTPPALRPYINVVKFGAGETVLSPQEHGEFGSKLEFWRPECWEPPTKNLINCYRPKDHD